MKQMNVNLRDYLQHNHNKITWKERFQITGYIIFAIDKLHNKNGVIHRDLHSGNILYSRFDSWWAICDLGFLKINHQNKSMEIFLM